MSTATAPAPEVHRATHSRAARQDTGAITAPARQAGAAPGAWRARTVQAGDHLLWTGPMKDRLRPEMSIGSRRRISVRHIAYTEQRGRRPVGQVQPTCGEPRCLASDHLADHRDRQQLYRAAAKAAGRPTERGTCRNGHSFAEYARFLKGGRRACAACRAGDGAFVDETAVAEAVSGRRAVALTRPERLDVVRRLTELGVSCREIAPLVGVSRRTVVRWRTANGWRRTPS